MEKFESIDLCKGLSCNLLNIFSRYNLSTIKAGSRNSHSSFRFGINAFVGQQLSLKFCSPKKNETKVQNKEGEAQKVKYESIAGENNYNPGSQHRQARNDRSKTSRFKINYQ